MKPAGEGGRTAVITGGLGALATALAAELKQGGYTVLTPGREELDVTNPAQIRAYFERLPELYLLVNNAAVRRDSLVPKMDWEDWDAVIKTNLTGVFHTSRAAFRLLSQCCYPTESGDLGVAENEAERSGCGLRFVSVESSPYKNETSPSILRRLGKLEYLKLVGSVVNAFEGRVVTFSKCRFGKPESHSADPRIMRLIPALPQLLRCAAWIGSEAEADRIKHPNILGWHNYLVRANLDGQALWVGINTFEQSGDPAHFYHDHNMVTDAALEWGMENENSENPATGPTDPVTNRAVTMQDLAGNKVYLWAKTVKKMESPAQTLERNQAADGNSSTAPEDAPTDTDSLGVNLRQFLSRVKSEPRKTKEDVSPPLQSGNSQSGNSPQNHSNCGGHIINIGSYSALSGPAGQANYAAAKAGLIALTQSLAREFGPANVRVNCVLPGWLETPFSAGVSKNAENIALESHVLGRFNTVSDAARAIAFLDTLPHLSGQVISLDSRIFPVL